jgi:hypothetical protein
MVYRISSMYLVHCTNLVVRQENSIANGCFQEFSCEHRIGEGGETTREAWAKNTEHRKTKIESGRAHQNYRFPTDGSGDALVHGRNTHEEPRTR